MITTHPKSQLKYPYYICIEICMFILFELFQYY